MSRAEKCDKGSLMNVSGEEESEGRMAREASDDDTEDTVELVSDDSEKPEM